MPMTALQCTVQNTIVSVLF